MAPIRGLEMLYSVIKDDLKSKEDLVVAAVHSMLINLNLIYDDGSASGTELLPKLWNSNQEVYTLRYRSKDGKNFYLLKAVNDGRLLHLNVELNEETAVSWSVSPGFYVTDNYQKFAEAYDNLEDLDSSFQKKIYEKLHPVVRKPLSSEPPTDVRNPQIPGPPILEERPQSSRPNYPRPELPYFPRIGERDLDPLARGGGGNIFDHRDYINPNFPRVPPGLPRGAVPPGARFDPIGPTPGLNRFEPSPDHMRWPDNEDFYM